MGKREAGKMCVICVFYPDDCDYWHPNYRRKNKNASFLYANVKHNCPDFKESIAMFLPDEMQGFGL